MPTTQLPGTSKRGAGQLRSLAYRCGRHGGVNPRGVITRGAIVLRRRE